MDMRCCMSRFITKKGYGDGPVMYVPNPPIEEDGVHYETMAVDIFKGWLQKQNRTGNLEYFTTAMLNDSLSQFYVDLSMDPSLNQRSLENTRDNILQFIAHSKQWTTDFTFSELSSSNIVLENLFQGSKETEQISKSKGFKKTPMTRNDLKNLITSDLLSSSTPIGLLRKVWYDLTVHLGVCGQDAMRAILDDSLLFETDDHGMRYCRLASNIQGKGTRSLNEMQQWDWNARMYEVPGDPKCPLVSLNLYMSKRNPNQKAFFQRPKPATHNLQGPWYDAPLGHCILARLMSRMSEEAGLSRIYTNSSVRLTAATLLEEQGISVLQIMHTHPRYKTNNQYQSEHRTSDELFLASNTLHRIMYNL